MAYTLTCPAHSELLIRKSRFIGCVQVVSSRMEALSVVAALRQSHPDAVHVCWALYAGGQSAAVDDGEPGGTAGRPMLEVLRRQELENVLATVVRYYGGIRLGAGGLLRAYTDAVAQALLKAQKVPLQQMKMLRCRFPYAFEGTLRHELERVAVQQLEIVHGQDVEAHFCVSEQITEHLVARLNELGQGRLVWVET